MNKLGVTNVVHVIEYFLFMADSLVICERDMKVFIDLCKQTGVPLTPEKTVGRATALQLVRITLDAVSMMVRLPEDKLTQCR